MNTNVIGPLNIQRESEKEWDEIIYDSQYYYFKNGTYNYISSGPPCPRPGWEWYIIGEDHYMVKIDEPNFDCVRINSNLYNFVHELCAEATREKFDIHIDIDFDNVKSFKEIFEALIEKPNELFNLFQYIIDKLNIRIKSGQLNEYDFVNETTDFLEKTKFIDFESRFQIIKNIIVMLREQVNDVGPVAYAIPINDKWEEIEHDGFYYYFRKGFYIQVEEVNELSDGYKLYEIGESKYVVFVETNMK